MLFVVGPALCLISATCFGAMAVFGKFAYEAGVTPGALVLLRFALAAVLMGVAMWFGNALFQPYVTGTSLERWSAMLLLVAAGGLVYGAAVLATGAFRLAEVRQLLRRSTKA